MAKRKLTAIDLFSGAGGISVGLEAEGYDVLLANDINPAAAKTHERNFPSTPFVCGDIRTLSNETTRKLTKLRSGELDLLIGGPPCQGFSIIGARESADPRNVLFREFLRIASELKPRCLVIENVPGLATLDGGVVLNAILDGYRALGYSVGFAELLAAQYGVPQMRWRMVFIGFRSDLGIPTGMGFPKPSHGRAGIGDLVPNCTISPEEMDGFLTARDAIGDLPPVEAGGERSKYTSSPASLYQKDMRSGLRDELFNHYAPKLSEQNLERLAALGYGQDWRDLPVELLPESMKRAKRKDHTRRFSRMTWEGVPRSIITRFRDPKSGEYTHPEQNRTISIREAARIQSFPDRFVFEGTHSEQYDQVGNAVPPRLAAAIGREVRNVLDGTATHRLVNPFSRRRLLSQVSFSFDAL
ncbi:MAG: DNA cytosine methyltransferase [Lysobacter sp.]|nr:DNA cytosine methyltransferase [Lysobacter sp.]